jgi:hypothetical protein
MGVRKLFKRVFAKQISLLHKGMGDMGEKPELSNMGPVSPTPSNRQEYAIVYDGAIEFLLITPVGIDSWYKSAKHSLYL